MFILRAFLVLFALSRSYSRIEAQERRDETGSTVLFTIPEHDLYPESIAFDSVSGDYFLSSMGTSRILRIHADGRYEDFLPASSPIHDGSVGMKVDPVRRYLWVCVGRYAPFGGSTAEMPLTGVMLFSLDDGSLVRSWTMDQPSPGEIFNDLAIARNGDAYVTTTLLGKVFRISPADAGMALLVDSAGRQTNGITLGPDERYLFMTLGQGISRYDLETGEIRALTVPDGSEVGTDGLYFVDGSLVVVKPRFGQVARLFLNASMAAVERVQILAGPDPSFAYPTTGVVVGNELVFVATSHADVPRNTESPVQHPDVLIHRLRLRTADSRF